MKPQGFLFLFLAAACASRAAEPTAADMARSIREAGLDPTECYRVHDLSFVKEDIRLYFNDGYLMFSKPVAGEPLGAVFSADTEGGDGEILLLPPHHGERQSLARFTESPNLDEHFRAAVLILSEGSGRRLLEMVRQENVRKAPEIAPLMAEQWGPTITNIATNFEIRLLKDVLSPGRESRGLFFVALTGTRKGNFDVMFDHSSREQILAAQLVERNDRQRYDVWTSFQARSFRTGVSKPPQPEFSVDRFRIEAALDPELRLKATTRATVRIGASPLRVFGFEISRAMEVAAARIDGAPAELRFRESVRGRALRADENDPFLVVAPENLAAGSEHEIEFEHEGAVIGKAGENVYFVGARSNWYPRSGDAFARYDLTFRYPKRLTLVTPGEVVEDRAEGDWRITQRRTAEPIRTSGFNLGEYEKVSSEVAGISVEVYGNRHLEAALMRRTGEIVIVTPGTRSRPAVLQALPPPPQPDPLARLRTVAADIAASLQFFSGLFGPPPLKSLTVSPIPGTFGQGFPGLVYLSTLSYLDPSERPAGARAPQQQLFFSDLIQAHEVAHQWWGNVVTPGSYQDEWLSEGLANYSALLWLEKRKGTKALEDVLAVYRDHLIDKDDQGRTIESAGPITWGSRLDSSGVPEAWRLITYEKGAWIFHMLRRRLGDGPFLKLLGELRRRYEFKSISTAEFRELVKEFLPPRTRPAVIDGFFDNWAFSTGVPDLKVKYSAKGIAPAVKLTGTVEQSGVDDDFAVEVPVEIQFAKGAPQTVWVATGSEPSPFSVTLRQAPLKVSILSGKSVLAGKK